MTGLEHTVEIERTYDVDERTRIPDWTALAAVMSVGNREVRDLDARYLDTDAYALARAGVALRRRTGGPDEGWHIKAAMPDGKHEWHWPLGEDAAEPVPPALAARLAAWSPGPFLPFARIRNTRHAYALRDAAGALVAEMVDDHVLGRNERSGHEAHWREWEVELGPAAPVDVAAFFAAVDALVIAAGGRVSASPSKLGRTAAL